MNFVTSILLILVWAAITCAQSEATAAQSTDVEVVKFGWRKQRIGWERDPFGGPLENFDEMRSRARNEKRIDDAKRAGGSAGADQMRREARADAANLARQREKGPSIYVFVYTAKLKNNGTTAIKAIDWDYVFFERGSKEEAGRQQFASEEPIAPGKSKELTVFTKSPPTATVSVTSLNLSERDRLTGKIVLVRVLYADGKIWSGLP